MTGALLLEKAQTQIEMGIADPLGGDTIFAAASFMQILFWLQSQSLFADLVVTPHSVDMSEIIKQQEGLSGRGGGERCW